VSDQEVTGVEPTPVARRGGGGRHRRGPESTPVAVIDQSSETTRPAGRPRRSRRRSATVVIAALWLPAAAAAIVFWVQTPSPKTPASLLSANNQSALAAAKNSVHTILSYDYRAIASDISAAKADTTGEFARQYSSTAAQLLSEAKQVKAIVQATVGSAGVVSATNNEVVALLFVDQASVRQTAGQKTPTTRIDQSRVQVTMTRLNGKWLVSSLAAL
jgi:Mce-associated membrane protein